jgi:hypothetical protein
MELLGPGVVALLISTPDAGSTCADQAAPRATHQAAPGTDHLGANHRRCSRLRLGRPPPSEAQPPTASGSLRRSPTAWDVMTRLHLRTSDVTIFGSEAPALNDRTTPTSEARQSSGHDHRRSERLRLGGRAPEATPTPRVISLRAAPQALGWCQLTWLTRCVLTCWAPAVM